MFSKTIKLLKEKLFKKDDGPAENDKDSKAEFSFSMDQDHQASLSKDSNFKNQENPKPFLPTKLRDPYLVQLGFDFGTSFSKCIYREIAQNKAWVFHSDDQTYTEYPFLIPTTITYDQGFLRHYNNPGCYYSNKGLFHIKLALQKIALGDWNADVLNSYKNALGEKDYQSLVEFIESIAVFFLAGSFQKVKKGVQKKFPDFGSKDQLLINMAIPVADSSNPAVSALFEKVLVQAWALSHQKYEFTSFNYKELNKLRKNIPTDYTQCHVYPEVSANVQAFIRSPAAAPEQTAIYFFSDTGAGTVDQSVFTYTRQNSRLNYFAANVWLHGSSQVERIAAGQNSNHIDIQKLEFWRKEKENNSQDPKIINAKNKIESSLTDSTLKTIDGTLRCLPEGPGVTPLETLKNNSRLIFSGGGNTKTPYESAVLRAFSKKFRPGNFKPQTTRIRAPEDLDLTDHQKRNWMPRLYVAYGLSFFKEELTKNTFPNDNIIHNDDISRDINFKECSCRGITPNCPRCFGSGLID